MTTGRIDFYTKVHKALRANLFEVSRQAALADYGDPQAVSALAASVKALLAKLSAHAGHESRFIHPLIAEKTGACSFEAEHEVLEDEQKVLAGLRRLCGGVQQAGKNHLLVLEHFVLRFEGAGAGLLGDQRMDEAGFVSGVCR